MPRFTVKVSFEGKEKQKSIILTFSFPKSSAPATQTTKADQNKALLALSLAASTFIQKIAVKDSNNSGKFSAENSNYKLILPAGYEKDAKDFIKLVKKADLILSDEANNAIKDLEAPPTLTLEKNKHADIL